MTVLIAWLPLRVKVSQESLVSGDLAATLVWIPAIVYSSIKKWEHDLSVRIIDCREMAQTDFSTESDIVDFPTSWENEERQMPMKEEIKTPVRNVKVTDSSMILPSACLNWFVCREKKIAEASHLFVIKTQPGFSRDFYFKKQSGCRGEHPPVTQAATLKHLMDV